MNIIKIESKNVKNIANQIMENAENLEQETNKLKSNLEKLLIIWNGKDAEKYAEKVLEEYIPNLNNLSIILKSIGIYLNEVNEKYKKLDLNFSEKIKF